MGKLADKLHRNRVPQERMDNTENYQTYDDQVPIPETELYEEEPEEEPETSYEDVPIQIARDIKKQPTPKGYFRTTLFGIPIDLHSLEDYIVKTSPFAIKTLMRFDNARNIEEIKQYSTKTTGRKKLDMKVFLFIILGIIIIVVGFIMITKGPEIMELFKGGL